MLSALEILIEPSSGLHISVPNSASTCSWIPEAHSRATMIAAWTRMRKLEEATNGKDEPAPSEHCGKRFVEYPAVQPDIGEM